VIAAWYRRGGHGVPPDSESLSVDDDGTFHLWRSVGAPAAGRFEGVVDRAVRDALAAAAYAAAAAGDFTIPDMPGAPTETVIVADRRADVSGGVEVSGAWGGVIGQLRDLAEELVTMPAAALGIRVMAGGRSCRLDHLGSDPVTIDTASLRLDAHLWRGWFEPAGSWSAPVPVLDGGQHLEIGPGWSAELPFDHGLDLGPGMTLHAAVDVRITVAGNPIAAGLRWAPMPPR